jgi:hypothetical protein
MKNVEWRKNQLSRFAFYLSNVFLLATFWLLLLLLFDDEDLDLRLNLVAELEFDGV